MTTTKLRITLVWAITQLVLVISYRRFGVIYRYHLQSSRIQRREPVALVQSLYREEWLWDR